MISVPDFQSERGLSAKMAMILRQFKNMSDQIEEASHELWNTSTENYKVGWMINLY